VTGNFGTFTGSIQFDPDNPGTGSVQVDIDASSINTGVEKRDNHLRSADFFEVAKYPKLVFVSTGVKDLGGGKLEVSGNLTMHGVTKPIVLATTVLGSGPTMQGQLRAGFEATAKLDRTQYGIVWNRTLDQGGTLLSNDVDLTLDIEAVEHTADSAPAKK
jgi:polyisoprenoid-binding protein YceI